MNKRWQGLQVAKKEAFIICDNKGFHMTFANGWGISVQFGYSNYCDNQYKKPNLSSGARSNTAEIAILDPQKNMVSVFGEENEEWKDQVQGWCTPEEVLKWMNWTAKQ